MEASEHIPLIPPAKNHVKSVYKLVVFLILSGYALAMSGPASMDLQYYSICRSLGISEDQCFSSPAAAQAESAISGYSSTISSVLKLALVPVFMVMAHKFDRKPVFIASLLLSTLRHILMWYLAFYSRSSYYWLLVPTSLGTVYMSCFDLLLIPYICDLAPDTEHRARYIGWVVSATAITNIIGPASGSTLIDIVGLYNFYLAAIGLELLSVFLGGFLLEMQGSASSNDDPGSPVKHPLKSLGCLSLNHIHDPEERKNGRKVLATFILLNSTSAAFLGVLYLHVKYAFGWSAKEWGLLMSATNVVGLLSYSFISPLVTSKLRASLGSNEHKYDHVDRIALQYSIWVDAFSFGVIGTLGKSVKVFVTSNLLEGFSAVAAPNMIALICKYGPRDNAGTGKIFASFKLATSILELVVPFAVFRAYGLFLNYSPSSIFLVAAGLFTAFSLLVSTIKVSAPEHRSGTPVV